MNEFGTPEEQRKELSEYRDKLNAVSPSFCLAKWKQVTVHLATGHTHSCHHPTPHKIPTAEIAIDTSALHNTSHKKEQRAMMIEGLRPSECDYCWRVEDSDPHGEVFSDRVMKSNDVWAKKYFDEIIANPQKNINPSYLEVSFSNTCNFKCSYCSPEVSSKWMEEIKHHGGYPTSYNFNNIEWIKAQNKLPIPEREHNPYVEAFWKWWPSLYPDLEVLRITGGEPLLTKNTFKVLEYLLENPNPKLELNINSNLCVPEEIFKKFISLIKRIQETGSIKKFHLYTSCEAKGDKAEYIRYGMNYSQWLDNCYTSLREIPNCKLTVMSTYNALSVTSFEDFLKDMLDLRLEFSNENERHPVSIDIPYLRWPAHQSINILTPDYMKFITAQVNFMYHNMQQTYWPPLCGKGFYEYELNRMKRVYYIFDDQRNKDNELERNRKDFAIFVDEHDRRRGTNFLKTFPEMEEFYLRCKNG